MVEARTEARLCSPVRLRASRFSRVWRDVLSSIHAGARELGLHDQSGSLGGYLTFSPACGLGQHGDRAQGELSGRGQPSAVSTVKAFGGRETLQALSVCR